MKRNAVLIMLLAFTSAPLLYAAEKPVWRDDVAYIAIPEIPAEGIAHGRKFNIEKATIQNGILELRQGRDFFPDHSFMIFTFLDEKEITPGKTITVKPSDGLGGPHIHFKYKVQGKNMPETEMIMGKRPIASNIMEEVDELMGYLD